MGALTTYLQREFTRLSPPGWACRHETRLLPIDLENLLGYAPRVDLLLAHEDGTRRLWIEFEVSRADPVANHAKYATAHLFRPQPEGAAFVAMVSPHVARGRRNLAANMISVMRRMGIDAFQTPLFPHMPPEEVQRLNHLGLSGLTLELPPVEPELERALSVSQPVLSTPAHRIHYAGDLLEVMLNLRRWNEDVATPEGAGLWGCRTITYFVFDPHSRGFAPSKFCAYVPIARSPIDRGDADTVNIRAMMSLRLYATLDGTEAMFDGTKARVHLTRRLAMVPRPLEERPELRPAFDKWLDRHSGRISIHPTGPIILSAPTWFVSP